MTVFVVALFLPVTINFDAPPQDAVPSQEATHCQAQSLTYLPSRPSHTQNYVVPQTPGATTTDETIFVPHDPKRTSTFTLPSRGSTISLRSLARAEVQSVGWGKALDFNQPESRAKSPPPALLYNLKQKTNYGNIVPPPIPSSQSLVPSPRKTSGGRDKKFDQENFTVEPTGIGNGGLFGAINAAGRSGRLPDKTFVGTLGMPTDALEQTTKTGIAEKLEHDHEAVTVYVSDSDMDGHYERYCKTILWPIFHYQIPDHPKSKAYEDQSWDYYVKVNQAFANKIVKNWKKGDAIWVHDYHLLLLPEMIRKQLPEAQLGFFLHSAFPSSEIFRCIATRKELLKGMLGANMIGFQTEEYSHHFLQTCNRILNVEATKQGILLEDGRFVHVRDFPIGIDVPSLSARLQDPEVTDWIKMITERYAGKKIIVSRDKLDGIRGVRQKMLAYELFLNCHPEFADKVVLIQICPSAIDDQGLENAVNSIVMRINRSSLAYQPVVLLRQDIDYGQYLALLRLAECMMITSLREGMNLGCHEFVACQDSKLGGKVPGPLILSEFTGAASILGHHALLINPWDYAHMARTIYQALNMSPVERLQRWEDMFDSINHYNASHWYESCMEALGTAWTEHSIRDSTAVPRLSFTKLKDQYEKANRRLIIVDCEGTLTTWGSPNDVIVPTPKRALDSLNELIEDPKNMVYVMSHRMPEELEQLFRLVPGIGLIAENGAFLREIGLDEWTALVDMDTVETWKNGVKTILEYYHERIEGSRIEELRTALILRYHNAEDPEVAFKQAAECANHINDSGLTPQIAALPIDQGLFISEADINKSSATKLIEERLKDQEAFEEKALPDFVMVIGDSREDEYVFNWAHKLSDRGVRDIVTVTVGQRNTEASATLTQGTTGVISTLEKLARLPPAGGAEVNGWAGLAPARPSSRLDGSESTDSALV